MRRPWWALLSISIFVGLCTGCQALLPKRDAPPQGQIPDTFSLAESEQVQSNRWWRDFDNAELDGLIDQAMEENLSLQQLWARLDQAGAGAVIAGSELYPLLNLNADAGYTRTVTTPDVQETSVRRQLRDAAATSLVRGVGAGVSEALGGSGASGTTSGGGAVAQSSTAGQITREVKSFGLSLAAGYEVDLWGRIASQYRAARFDVQATRDELESTAITLAAEVTDRWLRIHEQQELQRVLAEQLQTNKTYLDLVELRFRKGLVSALDVYQQRQAVSEVESQIPLAQANEQVLRHDLAILLGKPPTTEFEIGQYDLSHVPDPPAVGVPADLLMRRPDVRSALALLHAADYRVASARADRLPAIRLSGGIGYSAEDVAHLFDDWFINLAAGLTQPLFDGYRRQAEVERTLAVVEERLASYRLSVLNAIAEVEDALARERSQREYINKITQQLGDAKDALREAGQRYQKGLNDYLPVLSALERTQALTRSLVTARRDLLIYRINLYRALGGTWTQELDSPERHSTRDTVAKETGL